MSELQAKRRFKILSREKARLGEHGQVDKEINAELEKILGQFPSLAATSTGVSQATAAMLNAGEAAADAERLMMDRPEGEEGEKKAAAATTSGAEKSAEGSKHHQAAPHEEKGAEQEQKQHHGDDDNNNKPKLNADEDDIKKQQQKQQRDAALTRLLTMLGILGVVLRVYNDTFNARPTFPAPQQGMLIFFAVFAALAHSFWLSPCENLFGRVLDPIIYSIALHLQCCLLQPSSSANNSNADETATAAATSDSSTPKRRRSLLEAICVYCVRDLIPSVCATYAVYYSTIVVTSIFSGRDTKVRFFCDDEAAFLGK